MIYAPNLHIRKNGNVRSVEKTDEYARDKCGRFGIGNMGGTNGGRPKGVKDKINKLRDCLVDYFLKEGPEKIIEAAGKESKKDVLAALMKMMPRINEIEDTTEIKRPVVIIDARD